MMGYSASWGEIVGRGPWAEPKKLPHRKMPTQPFFGLVSQSSPSMTTRSTENPGACPPTARRRSLHRIRRLAGARLADAPVVRRGADGCEHARDRRERGDPAPAGFPRPQYKYACYRLQRRDRGRPDCGLPRSRHGGLAGQAARTPQALRGAVPSDRASDSHGRSGRADYTLDCECARRTCKVHPEAPSALCTRRRSARPL